MYEIDIIISGGKILTLDRKDNRFEQGSIAIEGDSIVAVGKTDDIEKLYRGRKVINAEDNLVLPGFVNAHTHIPMTCFRGIADDMKLEDWLNKFIFPAEAKNVNPELVYWGSMLACAEMIRSGTTTFCDMYIFEDEVARAAHETGMRCLIGEVLFDFPSPCCKSPEEGLAYTRRLIEKWKDDPLVNIIVEPHSLYTCSPELLKSSKALADEYDAFLATHLLETQFERESLKQKLGKSATSFLGDIGFLNERFIAFHCVATDKDDISLLADHGCSVVHNPESNMKLASGVAPVPEMLAAGIPVSLGTDGCASNNNLDMLQEMDSAAKLHKVTRLDPTVMDAPTVLKMATITGAQALGLDKHIGTLEPGKKADIILIDLNQPHLTPMYNEYSTLVYAAGGSDVSTVIINGTLVMEDRRLLTVNEQEAMDQVRKIARKVSKSLEER